MRVKVELVNPRYIDGQYCEDIDTAIDKILSKLESIQYQINNLTLLQRELDEIKANMSKWRMDVLIND